MLQRLIDLFTGKTVRITHTNERAKAVEGVCKTIHAIPGTEDQFDIELEDGHRLGFVPEVVTDNSVDGELRAFAGGRRKIEIVPSDPVKMQLERDMSQEYPFTRGLNPNQKITAIRNDGGPLKRAGGSRSCGTSRVRTYLQFVSFHWNDLHDVIKKELREELKVDETKTPVRVSIF